MWTVWKIYYKTYEELKVSTLNFKPELIAGPLEFTIAKSKLENLKDESGFKYCLKPWN